MRAQSPRPGGQIASKSACASGLSSGVAVFVNRNLRTLFLGTGSGLTREGDPFDHQAFSIAVGTSRYRSDASAVNRRVEKPHPGSRQKGSECKRNLRRFDATDLFHGFWLGLGPTELEG